MAVSPWKTYKRFRQLVWSGRSRRVAKIVEMDREKRAQDQGTTPPTHTVPGGRSD